MKGLPSWAVVVPERRAHVERVAELVERWADAWRTPAAERERWLRAAYLHDALRDAPVEVLRELSQFAWTTAELLHGPAAAELARRHGETDRGVLDAIRYHTVGSAGWDRVGKVLYLADYLEPGRPFDVAQRAALAERVIGDFGGALRAVAGARLTWVVSSGWPLLKETVDFWNALASAG